MGNQLANPFFPAKALKRDWALALAFAIFCLAAQCSYILRADLQLQGDMERYIFIAASLLRGQWGNAINYHYPPFFPAVVAAASGLCGGLERAAWAVCAGSVALTALPVYFLGLALFGRRAAVLGSGFFALRFIPGLAPALPEDLAMLVLSLALLSGLYALHGGRPAWHLITGLVFGTAFLTKPEASAYFYTYVLIAAGAGIYPLIKPRPPSDDRTKRAPRPARKAAAAFALLIAGYALAAGPYLAAHWADTGKFSLNPKARTLFLIHNYLYEKSRLYQIEHDDGGFYTPAQRIYMDGDKTPLEGSIGSLFQ